ncbi:hypothetical protein AAZX31_10G091400 [Glycine max]
MLLRSCSFSSFFASFSSECKFKTEFKRSSATCLGIKLSIYEKVSDAHMPPLHHHDLLLRCFSQTQTQTQGPYHLLFHHLLPLSQSRTLGMYSRHHPKKASTANMEGKAGCSSSHCSKSTFSLCHLHFHVCHDYSPTR